MRRASAWISLLLHPVLMPYITLWLLMAADPHVVYFMREELQRIVLAMLAIMTIAFPIMSTLLLSRLKMISAWQMPHREERVIPFAMAVIYHAITYYVFRRSEIPLHPLLLSALAGILLATLLTTFITVRWKISAHMVGIGGLLGAIAGSSAVHSLPMLPLIALLIIVAGVLGTARMIAGEHTLAQINAGALLGFAATYSCVVLEVVP